MEQWHKKNVKEYGEAMCSGYAAYARVLDNLQSLEALSQVLICLNAKPAIPLHGKDSESGQEETGIAECRAVYQAMATMKKHGTSKANPSGSDPVQDGPVSDTPNGFVLENGDPNTPKKLQKQDSDCDILLAAASKREADPIMAEATKAAAAERAHVSIHTTEDGFFNEIAARVLPNHNCIVVVNGVNSAAKITLDILNKRNRFPAKCSTLVMLERRYGLCESTLNRFRTINNAKQPAFVIQTLAGESQARLNQCKLLAWNPHQKQESVVPFVNVSPCRHKSLEQVRLTCTNRKCPFLTNSIGDDEEVPADTEIHNDDKERLEDGIDFSESEEDDDDQAVRDSKKQVAAELPASDAKAMKVTLWPRTTPPVAYYKKILYLGGMNEFVK